MQRESGAGVMKERGTWKRVKLPLSDVIFRSWTPQTEREVKSEMASVLRRLSYSPCVLLALSPPPPLPPPLSPPSFVISSLCFAPMALLSFLLFALTAPFIHCLLSCLQLQHSHCSYTAGMFTFSQHQSLLFFLPLIKQKSNAEKDWLECVVWFRCYCSDTVTVYFQEKYHSVYLCW